MLGYLSADINYLFREVFPDSLINGKESHVNSTERFQVERVFLELGAIMARNPVCLSMQI